MLRHLLIVSLAWLAFSPGYAADTACSAGDKPAHMLVLGGTEDFSVLSEEAKARLRQYGAEVVPLLTSYGGVFKVRGRAGAVVEGTFPAWKNIVVTEWPCAMAAQSFWRSDRYDKEVHPLRLGGATYDIALYPPAPRDPRATGVWTAAGGPQEIKCDAPVYFVVMVNVKSADQLSAYRKAMADSGIQYAYGAVDILSGTPVEVLEGNWPEAFNAKVTRWPCREAFDAFYASSDYRTKYKPLRKDAGNFTAVLVPEYKPAK